MTRAAGRRRRSSRIAPTPSRRGMTRSMRITSGLRRSASRTAASPSPASPTISMPSCSARNVRRPSRTTSWSSTTSTLMALSATRRLQAHGGAASRRGVDAQPPAESPRSLLHRRQPEPPRAQLGVARVEAGAVVGDLEDEATVARAEPHRDACRGGVPQRVVQRLLGDAQDLRVALDVLVDGELDVDPVQAAHHLDVLAQHAGEAVALEVGRAQLEHEGAQLVERLARELLQPGDLRAGGTGVALAVAVEQRAGRVRAEHEAEELLADDVVQLEREPVALGEDRQLAAALVQP